MQAEAYSICEDIEIFGGVTYVGADGAAKQCSGIFSGSSLMANVIDDQSIDLRQWVDDLQTAIKYVFPLPFPDYAR